MAGKGDLVDQVAQETGMPKAQVNRVVDATLNAVSSLLSRGESVSLPGFGTFRVSETKERQGRNPRTGESMTIAARKSPSFRPGTQLKRAIEGDET